VIIGGSLGLSLIAKATLVSVLVLIAARMARRNRASARYLLFATTFVVLLALPLVEIIAPSVDLQVPLSDAARESFAALGSKTDVASARSNGGLAERTHGVAHTGIPVSISTLLLSIWATGTVILLLPMGAGLWQVRRMHRFGLPWRDGQALVGRVATDAGVGRPIVLLLHEHTAGPMTCGVLRPLIVLPRDAPQWNGEDVRRALLHEVEHVRRGDWVMHCVARSVCALYWFHPLVWVCWRHLGLEAERACDDAVVRDGEATAYADQLVTHAQRLAASKSGPLLAMASRGDLSVRVAAVLNAGLRRGRIGTLHVTAAAIAAALLVMLVAPVRAVQPPAPQIDLTTAVAFEVASIKRNVSGDPPRGRMAGDRFTATSTPVLQLIQLAYDRLPPRRMMNVPDWVPSERYDLVAKAPEGVQLALAMGPLMRSLLRDRFGFHAHVETREMPIYELVLARRDRRLGPKMQQAACDCTGNRAEPGCRRGGPPLPSLPEFDGASCAQLGTASLRIMRGYPMSTFARTFLAGGIDRVVVDKTGLPGTWNVELEYTPEQMPNATTGAPPADSPSLFTALQEQLGLKLQPARGLVEVLVIDSIERPTED
jgi:bla regulator protein BlaR1